MTLYMYSRVRSIVSCHDPMIPYLIPICHILSLILVLNTHILCVLCIGTFIVPLLMFLIKAFTPCSTDVLKELLAEFKIKWL